MKKQLLSIFAVVAAGTAVAQTPSPSWTIAQDPIFTQVPVAGTRFLDAVDANVAWVCGYDGNSSTANYNWFSRTTNGGATWVPGNIFPDTNTYNLASLEAIDANIAWVASYMHATSGEGAIHMTNDGGQTWTNMSAPGMFTNTTQSFCNFITWLTPSIAIVNGDPIGPGNGEYELWKTTDGGQTWNLIPGSAIPDPLPAEYAIVDMYSTVGPTHMWFGTNKGRVYRTTDAGATWAVTQVGPTTPTSSVIEVRFANTTNGLCYVVSGANQMLYNTTNGGVTWNLIPGGLPANFGPNEMCAIPGTPYFASVGNANNMLSYSTNNGVTWNDWQSVGLPYTTIDFADQNTGWAGGFTAFPTSTVLGIWKYHGSDFSAVFSLPSYICKGASDVTVSPVNTSTSSASPLTFSWSASPADVLFSSPTASVPVLTFSANGTYTITLEATSPAGIGTATQVISIGSCTPPVVSFSISETGCNNIALTLTNTSTGSPNPTYTITSSPSNNFTVTQGSGNLWSLKWADPGSYVVTVAGSNPSGMSSATQTVVLADCSPTVSFDFVDLMCRVEDTITTVNNSMGVISHTWSIAPSPGSGGLFTSVGTGTLTNRMIKIGPSTSSATVVYTITLRASNNSGVTTFSRTVQVTKDNCVGLKHLSNLDNNLEVFPNPAREKVNISLPASSDTYRIKLLNVLGAEVYETKADRTGGNVTINLVNQPKGIYFLTVETNTEKVTRKIVLE